MVAADVPVGGTIKPAQDVAAHSIRVVRSQLMKFSTVLKIGISALMLLFVARVINFDELKSTLLGVPIEVALLAVFGFAATQVVSALRWWIILLASGVKVPFTRALRAFFIGMYANCFGLGTVGGDLLKGALLTDGPGQRTQAITSAFADRALGLAVLSLIGVLATAFSSGHHMPPQYVYILTGVGCLILLGWVVGPMVIVKIVPATNPIRAKLEQISDVFHRNPRLIALAALVATAFHLLQISLQWLIVRGMGIKVAFVSMLVTVPFVNILSTLPVSWNGIGVRERAYIVLFKDVLTHEQAVALGALWLLALLAGSAIGGVIAFLSGGLSSISFRASAQQSTSAPSVPR